MATFVCKGNGYGSLKIKTNDDGKWKIHRREFGYEIRGWNGEQILVVVLTSMQSGKEQALVSTAIVDEPIKTFLLEGSWSVAYKGVMPRLCELLKDLTGGNPLTDHPGFVAKKLPDSDRRSGLERRTSPISAASKRLIDLADKIKEEFIAEHGQAAYEAIIERGNRKSH